MRARADFYPRRASFALEAGETASQRKQRQFQPVRHPALVENAPQVVLHGDLAETEAVGDIAVGQSVSERNDDLSFARREIEIAVSIRQRRQAFPQRHLLVGKLLRLEPEIALHDREDALEQNVRGVGLQHHTAGAELYCLDGFCAANAGREHDGARCRRIGGEHAQGFQSGCAGHREIQQQHVRVVQPYGIHSPLRVARFTNDRETGVALKKRAQAITKQWVIVSDDDANRNWNSHADWTKGGSVISTRTPTFLRRSTTSSPPSAATRSRRLQGVTTDGRGWCDARKPCPSSSMMSFQPSPKRSRATSTRVAPL